jgi:hypothetical protein
MTDTLHGPVAPGDTGDPPVQDSQIPTYAKMWSYMDQNKNVFTKSNKEGVDRVKREDGAYAFMMESTVPLKASACSPAFT